MTDAHADASYHRRLLFFLSVASFFEGYDFLALAQLLPNIRAHFGLSESDGGLLVTVVNAGTMIAYFLVRRADRWGRKKALSVTILGYTVASLLSGLAPNAWSFALGQLLARVFLIAEWAIALVVAAEEFPASRRASAMGIIQASSSLGAIACAGLVPILVKLPPGFRTVYFVGAIPLGLVALARRTMREPPRFEARLKEQRAAGPSAAPGRSLFEIFRGPSAKRVLVVALVWALGYVCTQTAVTFWKEFAVHERGFSDADVGLSVTIAALAAMPLAFLSGKLLDVIGRKSGAVLIFVLLSVGTALAYTLTSWALLTASLVFAIFGSTAILQVMNTFTTELFPTSERADAFAWSNNLLGRVGYVASPYFVGLAAEHWGWGPSVRATAIFPLVALAIIASSFPETKGKELEDEAPAMH
ncbi:MAG TPA: MFS transporter [Polyangiaceae bacterium]|nr:MFS transporter [Polyangiaceae bacterium]